MDFTPLVAFMELLQGSKPLKRIVWACIGAAYSYILLFGLAALIAAFR